MIQSCPVTFVSDQFDNAFEGVVTSKDAYVTEKLKEDQLHNIVKAFFRFLAGVDPDLLPDRLRQPAGVDHPDRVELIIVRRQAVVGLLDQGDDTTLILRRQSLGVELAEIDMKRNWLAIFVEHGIFSCRVDPDSLRSVADDEQLTDGTCDRAVGLDDLRQLLGGEILGLLNLNNGFDAPSGRKTMPSGFRFSSSTSNLVRINLLRFSWASVVLPKGR